MIGMLDGISLAVYRSARRLALAVRNLGNKPISTDIPQIINRQPAMPMLPWTHSSYSDETIPVNIPMAAVKSQKRNGYLIIGQKGFVREYGSV
jgi:hypothetical protein